MATVAVAPCVASVPQSREVTKLQPLQVGRGIAAIAVACCHAGISADYFLSGAPSWSSLLRLGGHGVDFFFVLSGFIIYWVNAGRIDEPGWLSRYVAGRALRIYLPYLPIGVGLAFAYSIFGHGVIAWDWLATATLLPGQPALLVAWTLQHEIAFYALMAVLFVSRRVGIGLVLWGAMLLVLQVEGRATAQPLLSIIDLEFIAGVALAYATMAGLLPYLKAALALPMPQWAVLLGDASYAIYLIHAPLLSLTSRAALAVGLGWHSGFVLGLAASIGAGIAFHLWFEAPALRTGKRWVARLQHSPSP